MKYIAALFALLALACENPITHFTEPREKDEVILIPACKIDTLPNGEPLPPGYQDTKGCKT